MRLGAERRSRGLLQFRRAMTGQEARPAAAVQDQQEPQVPLSLAAFTAVCVDTTKADSKTGKPANTISETNLKLLARHGEAGGVISMEMTRAMRAALFSNGACAKARAFLRGSLDFPTKEKRDEQGKRFAAVEAAVGSIGGYCAADFHGRWKKLKYSAVSKKANYTPKTTRECDCADCRAVVDAKEKQQQ